MCSRFIFMRSAGIRHSSVSKSISDHFASISSEVRTNVSASSFIASARELRALVRLDLSKKLRELSFIDSGVILRGALWQDVRRFELRRGIPGRQATGDRVPENLTAGIPDSSRNVVGAPALDALHHADD